jgi:hypothetical protein
VSIKKSKSHYGHRTPANNEINGAQKTSLDPTYLFTYPRSPFLSLSIIRFSAKVLTALCEQIEGIPISGIVVVGDGQAARSIALSGNAMRVPVLWAKGGAAQLQESSEVSSRIIQDGC